MIQTYIHYLFEGFAFFSVLFQYKKLAHTHYRYFLPFMVFILLFETAGHFRLFIINGTNAWAINIEITIEFLFYSIFITYLLPQNKRKGLLVAIAGLSLFTLIDIFLIQGFGNMATAAFIIQYIMLIALVFIYFSDLMKTKETLNLISIPDFWVSTGLLFYCLVEFLFFSAFSYMTSRNNYASFRLWEVIANLAIFIMYSCLGIAFLCFRNKKTSYS